MAFSHPDPFKRWLSFCAKEGRLGLAARARAWELNGNFRASISIEPSCLNSLHFRGAVCKMEEKLKSALKS